MLNELFQKITNYRWRMAFGSNSSKSHRYYYYENMLIKYKSLIPYKSLYLKANRLNQISTNEEICYSLILKLGSSIQQVKKRLSYTKYQFSHKSQNVKREVLLYRFKMAGQKVKLEMHFYKGSLFYYQYTFSYINENEKSEMLGLIVNKYGIKDINFENNTIIDGDNNCVLVNDYRDLSIGYAALNHPFFNAIFEEEVERKTVFDNLPQLSPSFSKLQAFQSLL